MAIYDLATTTNLVNLLPSSIFTQAVSDWAFPPVTISYSNNGASFTTNQAWLSLSQTTKMPYTIGHKMYFYATVQSDNETAVGIRWFSGTDYSTFLNQSLFIKTFTTEETVSEIWQYDDTSTTGWDFTFQSTTENTTNMRIKEAMVIDLTATYGAGNEPTKEWCDANIPLFSGAYSLLNSLQAGDIINCDYSGVAKTIKLSKGYYKLECWGASGGYYGSSTTNGAPGGYSVGVLKLTSKTNTILYSGGKGTSGVGTKTNSALGYIVDGGFNGGGAAVDNKTARTNVASGGGASDIRIGTDSLYARVIVAGGGGGTEGNRGHVESSLYGGGLTGGSYTSAPGGSQTAGGGTRYLGTFGQGSSNDLDTGWTGGGGGGWYGGGGSAQHYPAGGGSGYIYTSETAVNYPTGCLLNESYYLTEASTIAGNVVFLSPTGVSETGHSGNGYIRITFLGKDMPDTYDITTNTLGTSLVNIIGDSSFENDLWDGANYSTTEKYFGNRSLYFPVGTSYVANIVIDRPIVGHKYYGRRYIKSTGDNQPGDCRFEVWGADGENKNWVYAWNNGNHLEWEFNSAIHEIISVDYSETDRTIIRCFNVNTTADTWVDGLMLIDLTAAFGAGNEPSKAWCDKNIPYFEEEYTLPVTFKTGDILNCPYSGKVQTLTLPKGVYKLECWGAQGGNYNTSYQGGKGGYSTGLLTLADNTTLYLYTGQNNNSYGSSAGNTSGTAFNGGGYGKTVYYRSTYTYSCAGGGASDIRIGTDSLYARVIVAGGGSGSTNGSSGYYGGGITSGGYNTTYQATQTTAGSLGSFGVGANSNPSSTNYRYASAGGGGGWYGGGSSTGYNDSSTTYRQHHGGGSGYVYTTETAVNYPSGCLLNENYYLTDAETIAGNQSFLSPAGASEIGHLGNGYIRITVIEGQKSFQKMYLGENEIVAGYLGNIPLLNMPYIPKRFTIADLPIGALVKDVNSTFLGKPIIWKIIDKNHEGYPNNSVTLISDRILALRVFDTEEPNYNLNNRYSLSNIRQWLNSDAEAGQWYVAQHDTDLPPSSEYLDYDTYADDPGFLNGFSEDFKNVLLTTDLVVFLDAASTTNTATEIVTDKVFLISGSEVGLTLSNGLTDGTLFPIFNEKNDKIAYCTPEAIADSNYFGKPDDDTTGCNWWTRTSRGANKNSASIVTDEGGQGIWFVDSHDVGVRPLCNIPISTRVSKTVDEDGCYTLKF